VHFIVQAPITKCWMNSSSEKSRVQNYSIDGFDTLIMKAKSETIYFRRPAVGVWFLLTTHSSLTKQAPQSTCQDQQRGRKSCPRRFSIFCRGADKATSRGKVDIAVEVVERLIDYLKGGMASESGKTKLSGCHVVGNINTTSYRYT